MSDCAAAGWSTLPLVEFTLALLCGSAVLFLAWQARSLREASERSTSSDPAQHSTQSGDVAVDVSSLTSQASSDASTTHPLLDLQGSSHNTSAGTVKSLFHPILRVLLALIGLATLLGVALLVVSIQTASSASSCAGSLPSAIVSSSAAPSSPTSTPTGASVSLSSSSPADVADACTLTLNTTKTSTVTNGCALLDMDTSACKAQRGAAGLTGAWLQFSCRVGLTVSGANVLLTTDGQPNYHSNYFLKTDPCYTAYTPPRSNPNTIAAKKVAMTIPLKPTTTATPMRLGAVGAAINGVVLFDNRAGPGDNIYLEHYTFDQCMGHPAPGNVYHFHCEPYSISYNDSRVIGVMRDGHFVYGRYDQDGTMPKLDLYGGHTAVTQYSDGVPVYHFHTNEQTSTTAGTAGMKAWFLSNGTYRGSIDACTGC